MGKLGLLDALDYLTLLAAEAAERYDRAARRWLARLLGGAATLTADKAVLALGCLRGLQGRVRGAVAGRAAGVGEAPALDTGTVSGRLVAEPPACWVVLVC